MRADRAISLVRLRPNGARGTATPGQAIRPFGLISIKLKYLPVLLAYLKCLAAALRRTRGEMRASQLATLTACGSIWLFRGGSMASGRVAVSADAIKLRKIFRREATRR
jgi:hypothetical protein